MHERIYAWLLRLYPAAFRHEYAEEALLLFRDRLQDEQGCAARARLWRDILEDLGASLWREHRAALAGPLPSADHAAVPGLRLIRDGAHFKHFLVGAFGSIGAYYAMSVVLLGGAPAVPPWAAGRGAGLAAPRLQAPQPVPSSSEQAAVSIQGTVRVADTGEPVAGAWLAVVRLESDAGRQAGTPITIPDAVTDAEGRFVVTRLAPGSYQVVVMASGYVRYDTRTIAVETGRTRNLAILLVSAGSVSGRIQDIAGQPLAGVNVTLLRRAYSSNGDPAIRRVAAVRTNDLGEYRFYWVTPGRYLVTAEGSAGPSGLALDPVSAFDQAVGRGINEVAGNYPRRFYPGFTEEQKASILEVPARADVRGIDFTLAGVQGFRVRGRVVDARTGEPPPQMSVTGMGATRYFTNAGNGAFEYANVPPGRYVVSATASASASIASLVSPDSSQPRGTATVVVADADVDDVILTISAPRLVRGVIRFEGAVDSPPRAGSLRFSLVPQSRPASGSGVLTVSANEDGTFAFGSSSDDAYRVSMPNLPEGFYLKEARSEGVDVLDGFGRIAGDRLELLVSSKAGTIEGAVTDEVDGSHAGIQVVLVPGRRHRTDLFIRAVTDANGRFRIAGIPPGEYKAFAWTGLEDYGYFDPAVLDSYEVRGRAVQVEESSRQLLELQAIGVVP